MTAVLVLVACALAGGAARYLHNLLSVGRRLDAAKAELGRITPEGDDRHDRTQGAVLGLAGAAEASAAALTAGLGSDRSRRVGS